MRVRRSVTAIGPSRLPGSLETEVGEDFATKLNEMRIAAMAGIRLVVDDLRPDLRGPVAQHDDPPREQERFLDVVRDEQRREARPLPKRYKLGLHGDARER